MFRAAGNAEPQGAPKKDAARSRVIELRRDGLPVYGISMQVTQENTRLHRSAVSDILRANHQMERKGLLEIEARHGAHIEYGGAAALAPHRS